MGPQNSVPLQGRRSLLMNHKEKGFRLWARRFPPSVKIHEPVLIATVRYNRVPDISLAFTSYSLQTRLADNRRRHWTGRDQQIQPEPPETISMEFQSVFVAVSSQLLKRESTTLTHDKLDWE